MACADKATEKAKPAITINLIILSSLDRPIPPTSHGGDRPALVFKPRKLPALGARKLDIDQGLPGRPVARSAVRRAAYGAAAVAAAAAGAAYYEGYYYNNSCHRDA